MNKFEIIDEFEYQNYRFLKRVLKRTLKIESVKNSFFSVVLVDEKTIQEINKNYRKIDKVTDVISFAFEDNDKRVYNNTRILGEIYICIPRMKEQATAYGHSETRELAFLAVHGLLHLLGYDHMKKEDEGKMFAKQELILNGFKKTKREKD
ncbi:MAG: rRNA maturation RNase YbeY [Firmicutes bacterium]|nr:rRNA maturation RNase YbeY [Bacillota bacterium]